jgi:hypothetical protein
LAVISPAGIDCLVSHYCFTGLCAREEAFIRVRSYQKFIFATKELIVLIGLRSIYTDAGHKTCQKLPGTWGHEETDAQTFANWYVDDAYVFDIKFIRSQSAPRCLVCCCRTCDFVKTDSCFTNDNPSIQPADGPNCLKHYDIFAKALNATGRPMVHSVKGPCGRVDQTCSPADSSSIANLRRTSGDVQDNWKSVVRIVNEAAAVANLSKPGFFGDMDILEIGNGGLSQAEEETMFTMWWVQSTLFTLIARCTHSVPTLCSLCTHSVPTPYPLSQGACSRVHCYWATTSRR